MATYRRRGSVWRAEICRLGVRDSASFPTKAAAREWAIQREAEIDGTELKVNKTFADAARRYSVEVSTGKKGERWEQVRINAFQRTVPFWLDRLDGITPETIGRWRDGRKQTVSIGSVRREYNLIRSIFEVARREWQWLKVNPCHDVKMPSQPRPRTRRISDREIQRMLEALNYVEGATVESGYDEVAVAFLLALETAMRASEIITLTWDQVHLNERFVHLTDTKNGDSRDVPLSNLAVKLFDTIPIDRDKCFTISSDNLSSLFRKARVKAGLSGFTFHDSRREALSRLSKRLNVLQLARIVGHRNPKSLMIYYQESASEIAKLLD
jgi:integrase